MEKNIRNLINKFEVLSNSIAQETRAPARRGPIKQYSLPQISSPPPANTFSPSPARTFSPPPTRSASPPPQTMKSAYIPSGGNKNLSGKLNDINQGITELLAEIVEAEAISNEKFVEILQGLVEHLLALGCIDVEGNRNWKQKKAVCFARIQECNTELMKSRPSELQPPKANLTKSKSLNELPEEVENQPEQAVDAEEEAPITFKSIQSLKNIFDSKEDINVTRNFSISRENLNRSELKRTQSFSFGNQASDESKDILREKLTSLKHVAKIDVQETPAADSPNESVMEERLFKPSDLKALKDNKPNRVANETEDAQDEHEDLKETFVEEDKVSEEQPQPIHEEAFVKLRKVTVPEKQVDAVEDSDVTVDETRLIKPSALKTKDAAPKTEEVPVKDEAFKEEPKQQANLKSFSLIKNIYDSHEKAKEVQRESPPKDDDVADFDELCDDAEIDEDTDALFNALVKSEDLSPVSRDSECSVDTVINVGVKEEIDLDAGAQNVSYTRIPGIQICPPAPEGYVSQHDGPERVPGGEEYSASCETKDTKESAPLGSSEEMVEDSATDVNTTTLTVEDQEEQTVLLELDKLFTELSYFKDAVEAFDAAKDLSKVEVMEMQLYMLLEKIEKVPNKNAKTDKMKLYAVELIDKIISEFNIKIN